MADPGFIRREWWRSLIILDNFCRELHVNEKGVPLVPSMRHLYNVPLMISLIAIKTTVPVRSAATA